MRRLNCQDRVRIIRALCEGCSINATVQMTGVAKTSILRLLIDIGRVCLNHEDAAIRGLHFAEIEADEIWGFNHCKAKTLPRAKAAPDMADDVWKWYPVDRKSKAILSWMMAIVTRAMPMRSCTTWLLT